MARQNGAKIAFDANFRPRDWKGDLSRTRTVFMEALKRVDIALPAYDDEAVLWGDPSPEATVERMQAFGIAEIVVKNGPNSALVATQGSKEFVPVPELVVPVDPSAAGDGFNAGYLAARLAGCLDEARESYGGIWHELFRDAGRSDAELAAVRRVVMSAARGFGVLKMLQPSGDHDRDRKTLHHIALRELRNGSR